MSTKGQYVALGVMYAGWFGMLSSAFFISTAFGCFMVSLLMIGSAVSVLSGKPAYKVDKEKASWKKD